MDIASVAAVNRQGTQPIGRATRPSDSTDLQTKGVDKTADVSRQFEAILIRQILSESMKPLLQGGPSGQVYGYLVTDSLADSMSKGGGLGLSHVLQAQLTQ